MKSYIQVEYRRMFFSNTAFEFFNFFNFMISVIATAHATISFSGLGALNSGGSEFRIIGEDSIKDPNEGSKSVKKQG